MSTKKPLCPNAWAIPPSPLMLSHGNNYYTCSECGESLETATTQEIRVVQDDSTEDKLFDMKSDIVHILCSGELPATGYRLSNLSASLHQIADSIVEYVQADRRKQQQQFYDKLQTLKKELRMHTVPEGHQLITRSYVENSIDFLAAGLDKEAK